MEQVSSCSGAKFVVSDRELELCRQLGIPLRDRTAAERLRELLSFRSSPHLYHANCVITGKRVITIIPPESGYTVYDSTVEDRLNAERFGRPYDFGRGFFEQFAELLRAVPFYSRVGVVSSNENCDYCQGTAWSKNCYLCFRMQKAEDCLYSRYVRAGRDLVDCIWCVESELAYSSSGLTRCYDVAFCNDCQDCSSSRFLSECRSCTDCFCCVDLNHAQYCFANEQLTKEAYRRRIAEVKLSSRRECERWHETLIELRGQKEKRVFLERCENSSGNYLLGCSDAKNSFLSYDSLDIESCIGVTKLSHSAFSIGLGTDSELLYSCEAVGNHAYDVRFSVSCVNGVQHLEYCVNVSNGSDHCFGCVGLRRKSYSILNREYEKEEYFSVVERIKSQMRASGEYGQFLPHRLSPFAFNRSEAYDFLPLTHEEADKYGYRWEAEADLQPESTEDMPDDLLTVDDSVLGKRFRCRATGRPFSLQAAELSFHRRMGLALPSYSSLERLYQKGCFLRLGL